MSSYGDHERKPTTSVDRICHEERSAAAVLAKSRREFPDIAGNPTDDPLSAASMLTRREANRSREVSAIISPIK